MNKRTGCHLLCSVTLTFLCGNAFSQNISIDPPPDDCLSPELQTQDDSESMAVRLSCYNHKLDNLTSVLSGLINERKRLNNAMGSTIQDAQTTLSDDSAVVSEQQQTIQQLQLERAELRAQLHRLLSDKQPVQIDKETDERLFRNYSDAYTALSIENDELRKLLGENQASVTTYQMTAESLENTSEEQAGKIVNLENEVSNLKLTIADLSTRKKKLTGEYEKSESRIELMKRQLLTNVALLKLQRENITSLQQSNVDSAGELDSAAIELQRVKDLNAETVGNLIATKEKLYDQINTLTASYDQTRTQAKQASLNSMATLGARDKEISALTDELKKLTTLHQEETEKLARAEQEFAEANAAYTSEITSLNEKNSALNASNIDLGNTLDAKVTEIESLQNEAGETAVKLTASSQLIAKLETELSTANELTTELSLAKNNALESGSELSDQLQTRLTQINALQIERDRLAGELNAARPEIAALSKNLNLKNTQTSDLSETIASLETDAEKAGTTITDLQTRLATSEESNSAANEKVKSLTASVVSLENILKQSIDSNQHIEASLADIKNDLNASQERLDSKQSQLQELMAEKQALIDAHNALADESTKLASMIEKDLKDKGADSVTVTRLEDNSLVLNVGSNQLFRTGSSNLSSEGQKLLLSVGSTIANIDGRRIMIEGHSDNVPLGSKLSAIFKDNLGLSMARALTTATFFTESANIPANKMSVSGAGATKPLAENDTSEGRQQNRRVEILLLPANDDKLASAE